MLKLDKVPRIRDDEENSLRERWDTMDTVLQRLAAKGVVVPEHPPNFPIPEVTTTLVATDNHEFLKVNAKYLAWLNFIMPNIALCKGVILQAKNEKSHMEAMYRDAARHADEGKPRTKRTTDKEIMDNIVLDPRYIELSQLEQEMKQELELLNNKAEVLERTLRVISRHVEVKKVDAEMNRTAGNLPHRRARAFGGGE